MSFHISPTILSAEAKSLGSDNPQEASSDTHYEQPASAEGAPLDFSDVKTQKKEEQQSSLEDTFLELSGAKSRDEKQEQPCSDTSKKQPYLPKDDYLHCTGVESPKHEQVQPFPDTHDE